MRFYLPENVRSCLDPQSNESNGVGCGALLKIVEKDEAAS